MPAPPTAMVVDRSASPNSADSNNSDEFDTQMYDTLTRVENVMNGLQEMLSKHTRENQALLVHNDADGELGTHVEETAVSAEGIESRAAVEHSAHSPIRSPASAPMPPRMAAGFRLDDGPCAGCEALRKQVTDMQIKTKWQQMAQGDKNAEEEAAFATCMRCGAEMIVQIESLTREDFETNVREQWDLLGRESSLALSVLRLNSELAAMKARYAEVESQLTTANEALKSAQDESAAKSTEFEALTSQHKQTEAQIHEYKTEAETAKEAAAEAIKKANEEVQRAEEAASRAKEAEGRLHEAESKVEEAERKVQEADVKISEADARKEEADKRVEEADQQVGQAEGRAKDALGQLVHWKERCQIEMAERKKIFNVLQELRGNIRVFCRVRPLIGHDGKDAVFNPTFRLDTDADEYEVSMHETKEGTQSQYVKQHAFEFDRIFTPDHTQAEIFQQVEPLVLSVMDGYNVCIFAYGQTGSGKTHTMDGIPQDAGLNQRALQRLYTLAEERAPLWKFEFSLSMVEIYNEQIFDLLDTKHRPREKKLEIRVSKKGNYVESTKIQPKSLGELVQILENGRRNRAAGQTDANLHSSRSHSIVTVQVDGTPKEGEGILGRLHLIDLAGSEKIAKSKATGDTLTEAVNINKSLSALGDVIHALGKKEKHVPYRNSQLTHMLQDSLSGDSKTLMFVNVSPAASNVPESINSLNFATRARKVELGKARKNVKRIDATAEK